MCQPLSPSRFFIIDWSQSESLRQNIDIEGGESQAKLSGSGKRRGTGYPKIPRSYILLEKRSKKARECRTSQIDARILMNVCVCVCVCVWGGCVYLVHIFSPGLYFKLITGSSTYKFCVLNF